MPYENAAIGSNSDVKNFGAAGGDRTHFWVKPLETRTGIGLRKIQLVKKRQKVDDLSG
jgi:hypothetical protein